MRTVKQSFVIALCMHASDKGKIVWEYFVSSLETCSIAKCNEEIMKETCMCGRVGEQCSNFERIT